MRFTIAAGDLAASATIAVQLVQPRNQIRILRMIHMEAKGGELRLTTHNLDESVIAHLDAEITEPGAVAVDAQRISQLAASLPPSASISASTDDGALRFSVGRARYHLAVLPARDFPEPLTIGDRAVEIALDRNAIRRLFRTPMVAASDEVTREHLRGVHLRCNGNSVTAAGTDGHRLIATTMPCAAAGLNITVPKVACQRIVKIGGALLRTDGKIVEVINAERGITYASKLVCGTYPDYQRVVPPPSRNEATLDRREFVAALTRLEAFRNGDIDGRGGRLMVDWKDNAIALTLPDTGLTSAVEIIEAATDGEGHFCCNHGYLLSMANAIDADAIVINSRDQITAARFTAPDDIGFLGIVATAHRPPRPVTA
jgi:DNA polymerase-3 subunit beta